MSNLPQSRLIKREAEKRQHRWMGSGWVSEGAGSGKAFNRQLRSGGRSEPHWNGESQNDFSATHPTNLLLQTHSHGFPKAWQPLERREKKKERERGIVSERERASERVIWLGLRETKWQTRQAGDRTVQIYSKVCWYKMHNTLYGQKYEDICFVNISFLKWWRIIWGWSVLQ